MRSLLAGRGWWIALALLVVAIIFGSLRSAGDPGRSPERQSTDQGNAGFAAWVQLLRGQDLTVDQLNAPPSSSTIDPDSTLIALDLGNPTDADVQALQDFVAAGGYLVTGGDTDLDAIREITGLDPELGNPASAQLTPLLPVAQTEGVGSVESGGGPLFANAGSGLPALGSASGDLLLLGGGDPSSGGGEVALLSSSDALVNEQIAQADNAQFAIDLGRSGGGNRPVLFAESLAVDEDPAQGIGALPNGWGAGFLGLILAALTLVASRLRRLGPPDGDGRPSARPRADYVDAVARILARRDDLADAAEPVRQAAIAGIARRSGSAPAPDERDKLAAQAELAGVPAEEAEALSAPLKEPEDAIRAARALARVRR
jgi:hypothetical protein